MNTSKTDDYYVTALQIFDQCGVEVSGTIRVDTLMDKFAPFIKSNKTEYDSLKSLLDPGQNNPEISVTKLADVLNNYSKSQKSKVDLDESFNLKCGNVPQDSDSGISEGYQLLEELQSELRVKSQLASQLRSQLEYTDRHHDETVNALVAERDSLRAHLNMLREENLSLTHLRHDYDDVCERLCSKEAELQANRSELETLKKRAKLFEDEIEELETDKLTLQDLLSQSKEECHRVNEMYANRQSALLEENESMRSSHADLTARLQDQEEFLQQIIKEKVLLETELKDVLNKSNQAHSRVYRSIDVSFTEDQMLTALDSLNADSRCSQDNQLLDEESFLNALKEDQGRPTNMSLFDELRCSFSTKRHSLTDNTPQKDRFQYLDTSFNFPEMRIDANATESFCSDNKESSVNFITTGTQTDDEKQFTLDHIKKCPIGTQTDNTSKPNTAQHEVVFIKAIQSDIENLVCSHIGTQTDEFYNNNVMEICMDCSQCSECDNLKRHINNLETDVKNSQRLVEKAETDLAVCERNLDVLEKLVDDGTNRNSLLQAAVDGLQSKIVLLERSCANQKDIIDGLKSACEMPVVQSQTKIDVASVSTQVEVPCADCLKRDAVAPQGGLRQYLWEAFKCLFQVFAVMCFVCAVCALYGVARRPHDRCRPHVPWRWLHAQDILDLLLRIDYVADVPM